MSARYRLEELRETLLADPYFMECIRDAAEKVPERSPFPGMSGGWFDKFFDSVHDRECEEHHGYRWAMRTAKTSDEVFEAVRLTLGRIGYNKDWSAGEMAVFECSNDGDDWGGNFSCRWSVHEIGGLYFVWKFEATDPERWDSLGSNDWHDYGFGFYLTFEDALEEVIGATDSWYRGQERDYEERLEDYEKRLEDFLEEKRVEFREERRGRERKKPGRKMRTVMKTTGTTSICMKMAGAMNLTRSSRFSMQQ